MGDKNARSSGHCTPSRILRMPELSQLLGISRSNNLRKNESVIEILRCNLPRPVRLGSGSVGWRSSAIDEWLTLHTVPARSAVKGVNDE
ncbi:helix-turn-helix transcriptional regulator [Escherichia coli]|uniref:helix-turn-helix transcriptional regulator n=1 Tax=Escherichia coli TaxID=562 RepID=UPI00397B8976